VPLLVALNVAVHRAITYVEREEAGVWTPEETLLATHGSCRDSAVLLMAVLRARGIASRFVSGYLIQLANEALIEGEPVEVTCDSVALHAWAEAYLPGAGWIGLDATSGLLCGEGHIPLACTSSPALSAPIEGTSDVDAEQVSFEMHVERLTPTRA
jgi:transglutaminase-like putative cysteine protease